MAGMSMVNNQFSFVKMSATDEVVLCDSITDIPCGILQNNPIQGDAAEILVYGISKIVAGAALNIGDIIGTDTNSHAVPYVPGTDTTSFGVGQVVFSGGSGEIASVLVNCANPLRLA